MQVYADREVRELVARKLARLAARLCAAQRHDGTLRGHEHRAQQRKQRGQCEAAHRQIKSPQSMQQQQRSLLSSCQFAQTAFRFLGRVVGRFLQLLGKLSGAVDVEDADNPSGFELPGADLSDLELDVVVLPAQEDEFTCANCFLVKHRSQLDHESADGPICSECSA